MAKSNELQSLRDILKKPEPTIGVIEAIKEGFQAVAPGLSLSKFLGDIGTELKQQAAHGAHEIGAILYSGSGFVMYPRTGEAQEDQQHAAVDEPDRSPLTPNDLHVAAMEKAAEPTQEQSRERGGMER